MSEQLVPQRLLFRFAVPCYRCEQLWTAQGTGLSDQHRLVGLAELEGRPLFAEVYAGWSEQGLAFKVQVTGKRRSLWCRTGQPEESDGLHLWIDTRDVHNSHRASRFCHRFVFLPTGLGGLLNAPHAELLAINRAREHPKHIDPRHLGVRSQVRSDGYLLECFLPAKTMTGYDPAEHPRLGFTYAVLDRELGEQTFSVGSPLPYQEDPSLWATLELIG